jgi:hypothetical protein
MIANGNGIRVAGRTIPYGAITVVIALIVQFVAIVAWANNQANRLNELQHRFDNYLQAADVRNKNQDEFLHRLDVPLMQRRLDVIDDRLSTALVVQNEMRSAMRDLIIQQTNIYARLERWLNLQPNQPEKKP